MPKQVLSLIKIFHKDAPYIVLKLAFVKMVLYFASHVFVTDTAALYLFLLAETDFNLFLLLSVHSQPVLSSAWVILSPFV